MNRTYPQASALRILHVIRGLANSSGTTHIVVPLAEAQADLGARVTVLHVAKPGEPSLVPDPARVASCCYPMSLRLNNPGLSRAFARALPAALGEADVVHVHAIWNFPSWWAMRGAVRAGVPCMVAPQGSFDPWALGQNRWGKRLYGAIAEMRWLRRVNRLQALTEKEVAQFEAAGLHVGAEVIPNGIDPAAYAVEAEPLRRTLQLADDERTLLFLSRVHPKKGLDLLLRAFARLRTRHRVTLVVAGGDGGSGYLDRMRALAASLGVAAHCRFLGEVSGADKFRVLKGADAYALVSRSEGLPVAALEALGAGLPSVLSEECNLPEVGRHEAGWVVPPDEDAAAVALDELFANPDLAARRAAAARKLVAERFTWPRIAAQTLEAYRRMLNDGAALER